MVGFIMDIKFLESVDKDQFKKHIKNSVSRSQRCQRNWDLSREIPQEDLDIIVHSATECPTKQNNEYYSLYVIKDREKISAIHEQTQTAFRSNPQVLANVLLVFVQNDIDCDKNGEQRRIAWGIGSEKDKNRIKDDRNQAVGVAAGFVNVVSSLLGYQTGCNKCFEPEEVKRILGTDQEPILMMGIGYKDPTKPRQEHHLTGKMIGSFNKKIKVVNL